MNYTNWLDSAMAGAQDGAKVLLHSCCAVCSSYVLEYLSRRFAVTVFYYNPNIYPRPEYEKRKAEQQRLIREAAYPHPVDYIDGGYDHGAFLAVAGGLSSQPEGGERCYQCFLLRLSRAAQAAAEGRYDFFATTLTVSPHKNVDAVNRAGEAAALESGAVWLYADFKKRDGYMRATQLARQYGIYRQRYCGCEYSLSPDAYTNYQN